MVAKAKLRFQYGKSPTDGQWYWRVRSRNSEIVAQGEGYKRKAGVIKVWKLLALNMGSSALIELK